MAQNPIRNVYVDRQDVNKQAVILNEIDRQAAIVDNLAELRAYSDPVPYQWVMLLDTLIEYAIKPNSTETDNGDTIVVDAAGRRYQKKVDSGKARTLFETQQSGGSATYRINESNSLIEIEVQRSAQTIHLPALTGNNARGIVLAFKNRNNFNINNVRLSSFAGDTIDFISTDSATQRQFRANSTRFFVARKTDTDRVWYETDAAQAFSHPQEAFESLDDHTEAGDWLAKETTAATRKVKFNVEPNGLLTPIDWNAQSGLTNNRLHIYTGSQSRTITVALPTAPNDGDMVAIKRGASAGALAFSATYTSSVNFFDLDGALDTNGGQWNAGALNGGESVLFSYTDGAWTVHKNLGGVAVSVPKVFEAMKHIAQTEANNLTVNEDGYTIAFPSGGGTGGGNSEDFAGFLNYVAPSSTAITAEFETIYQIGPNSRITLPNATNADVGRNVWFKNATNASIDLGNAVIAPGNFGVNPVTLPALAAGDYAIFQLTDFTTYTYKGRLGDLFSGLTTSELYRLETNTDVESIRGNNYLSSLTVSASNFSTLQINENYATNVLFHMAATGAITITLIPALAENKNHIVGFRKASSTSNQILAVTSSSTINNNRFAVGATSNNTWSSNSQVWFRSNGSSWDYIANPNDIYTNQTGVFQTLKKIAPTATFNDSNETMTVGGGEQPITVRTVFQLTSNTTASNNDWIGRFIYLGGSGYRTLTMPDSFGSNGDKILFGVGSQSKQVNCTRPDGQPGFIAISANDTLMVRKISGKWYYTSEKD